MSDIIDDSDVVVPVQEAISVYTGSHGDIIIVKHR